MRARNSMVLAASCSSVRSLSGFFEGVDLGEDGEHFLDGTFVGGAEDFGEGGVEHGGFLWGWRVRARKLEARGRAKRPGVRRTLGERRFS